MAAAFDTRHATVLKAFFIFGILLLVLGVDGAEDTLERRTRKQERSSRSKDRKTVGMLDRAPSRAMDAMPLCDLQDDKDITPPQLVPYDSSQRSISPWNYSYITDDNLFPSVIPQAYCLKVGCLDVNGEEDMNLISKPILHQITVLRRMNQKNRHVLKVEKKMISVGCTCVRPFVLSQD